jgi:hypothetical protein
MSRQPRDSVMRRSITLCIRVTRTQSLFLTIIISLLSTFSTALQSSLYDTLAITNSWTLFSRYYFLFSPRRTKNGQTRYETFVTPVQILLLTSTIHSTLVLSFTFASSTLSGSPPLTFRPHSHLIVRSRHTRGPLAPHPFNTPHVHCKIRISHPPF